MEEEGCRGKVIREIVEIKESEGEGDGQGQRQGRPGREEGREKMFSMFKGRDVNYQGGRQTTNLFTLTHCA